jgi:hypothetical protein
VRDKLFEASADILATDSQYHWITLSDGATNTTIESSEVTVRESSSWLLPTALAIYVAILFAKAPTLFVDPRFWAEEGTSFFPACQKGGLAARLSYLHFGTYQFLANAAVYLSTKVPLALAPLVTSFLALALQMVVVAQLVMFANAYRLSTLVAVLLVAAWALLPQMFEVGMSATNMQWVAGASVLLIFAMPLEWLTERWKGAAIWCVICGFSGVPAVLFAPLFFLRALLERSEKVLAIGVMLAACAAVQAALIHIYALPDPNRAYSRDPILLGVPIFLQTILSPIASIDFADAVGKAIASGQRGALIGALGTGLGILALVVSGARANHIVWLLLLAWAFLTLVQSFGGLAAHNFLSGCAGGRYFLTGALAICLIVALGTASSALRSPSTLILVMICVCGVVDLRSRVVRVMLSGPSWSEQVRNCDASGHCLITVWPGSPWIVDVVN